MMISPNQLVVVHNNEQTECKTLHNAPSQGVIGNLFEHKAKETARQITPLYLSSCPLPDELWRLDRLVGIPIRVGRIFIF